MDIQTAFHIHIFRAGMTSVLEALQEDRNLGKPILGLTAGDNPVWFRDEVINSRPVLPIDSQMIEAHTFHTDN